MKDSLSAMEDFIDAKVLQEYILRNTVRVEGAPWVSYTATTGAGSKFLVQFRHTGSLVRESCPTAVIMRIGALKLSGYSVSTKRDIELSIEGDLEPEVDSHISATLEDGTLLDELITQVKK